MTSASSTVSGTAPGAAGGTTRPPVMEDEFAAFCRMATCPSEYLHSSALLHHPGAASKSSLRHTTSLKLNTSNSNATGATSTHTCTSTTTGTHPNNNHKSTNANNFLRVDNLMESSSSSSSTSAGLSRLRSRSLKLDDGDSRVWRHGLPVVAAGRAGNQENKDKKPFLDCYAATEADMQEEEAGGHKVVRVRSFKRTSKGVVSQGDVVRSHISTLEDVVPPSHLSRPSSFRVNHVTDSATVAAAAVGSGSSEEAMYRIKIVGGPGVGKSTMCRQFTTSEYLGGRLDSVQDEDSWECVTIAVDGKETNLFLLEVNLLSPEEITYQINNAGSELGVLIVFAVDDRSSFDFAQICMSAICISHASQSITTMMIANKCDLARCREVSAEEAKMVCQRHNIRLHSVSTALNHGVDEALVSLVTQMRRNHAKAALLTHPGGASCSRKASTVGGGGDTQAKSHLSAGASGGVGVPPPPSSSSCAGFDAEQQNNSSNTFPAAGSFKADHHPSTASRNPFHKMSRFFKKKLRQPPQQ